MRTTRFSQERTGNPQTISDRPRRASPAAEHLVAAGAVVLVVGGDQDAANLRRYRVRFADAATAFEDPSFRTTVDPDAEGEPPDALEKPYQPMINAALREYLAPERGEGIESTLRRVIREELKPTPEV